MKPFYENVIILCPQIFLCIYVIQVSRSFRDIDFRLFCMDAMSTKAKLSINVTLMLIGLLPRQQDLVISSVYF